MNNILKVLLLAVCGILLSAPAFAISETKLPAGKQTAPREYLLRAITKYTNTISTNPRNEDAYINRAYLNYLLGNVDLAIKDYDVLININPNNEEFFLNRGYLNHISNRREAALNDYNQALKIKPNYAFAHNNKGVVLAELGKPKESLESYNTAIQINPNYADAYYNRGNLKTNTNHNEEALSDFDTAIKLNPTDSASYNNRGVVKRKLNCNVGALSDFTIAIKLDPQDMIAYSNRGHLKKRYFDSEGAEEDFNLAVKVADANPKLVKDVIAQNQIEANQRPVNNSASSSASTTTLKGGVERGFVRYDFPEPPSKSSAPAIATKPVVNPELAECYYIRGLQKYILQNREGALADFNMAINHNSNYADAYYYRAAIKRDMKDGSFVEDYQKAIALNPNLKSIKDADVLNILK